ncbi:MAG TPA: methionine synthase [Actinobacteria bacterium]|nr:methionine synthase [Actinomycetota bacterium]
MKKILGACIGSCVHVAGILNFLNIAKRSGYETRFLGSALSIDDLAIEISKYSPDIAAVSYRLSPESIMGIFDELKAKIKEVPSLKNMEFILGTTRPVAEIAERTGIFTRIFTGEETEKEVEAYLKKIEIPKTFALPPGDLIERIKYKEPYPLIRHHFGRPDLKETLDGIKIIAESGLLDIISIGPDQNTQEFFFHPEKMDPKQDGAGGVPLRSEEDFKKLYKASRIGNHPLLRCYSGTNDILKMARVLHDNINNAWCAIPLFWYNELDNRSSRRLVESIAENQSVMKWHGRRGIPVEVNESHHWSLRYAPDAVAVAAAYLAAYNAKKMGVETYISQYMFNTPPETSFIMDLAKMLAKIELIESLHDDSFTTIRETRAGLFSYPADLDESKGQLASSTMLQMQLDPGIVHIVGYCEADHAAGPDDIIKSTKIAGRVIENCIYGCPDMKKDIYVQERKKELLVESRSILDKIISLGKNRTIADPLISPKILAEAVNTGILDAPHLCGVKAAKGTILTMFVDGKNCSTDKSLEPISEKERLDGISI